jgi:hypothetical protein
MYLKKNIESPAPQAGKNIAYQLVLNSLSYKAPYLSPILSATEASPLNTPTTEATSINCNLVSSRDRLCRMAVEIGFMEDEYFS